jgi:hypothetical protein
MIVIAKGSIPRPDSLAPHLGRVDTTLPFAIENLATLEYDEIYEI